MADNTDDLIISISTDQATLRRSIKRIEQDLAGLAGGVQKQFAAVGKSIDSSVSTTMQKRIDAMTGVGVKAAKEWNGALAEQGKELERLRARYSPLFATINNYKTAVSDIRRAHALGAISATEMTAAISKERQAALASTAAIKGRNAALADTPTAAMTGRGNQAVNTANLAAQFQDIAVTSAMGMSPLQIALQQGTQISAVLGPMGAAGAVKSLGAAFLSIINPVSLATIGLVAGGAAAIQYFSGIGDDGKDAEKLLATHADLIRRIKETWPEATAGLKEYSAESAGIVKQDTVDKVKDYKTAVEDAANAVRTSVMSIPQDQFEGQTYTISLFQAAVADLDKSIAAGDPNISAFVEKLIEIENRQGVPEAIRKLIKEIRESAKSGIEAQRALDPLIGTINGVGLAASQQVERVSALSKALSELSGISLPNLSDLERAAKLRDDALNSPAGNTEAGVREIEKAYKDAVDRYNRQNPLVRNGDGMLTGVPIPGARPNIELEGLPGADKANKKEETAAQKAANAYRDLIKSADDRIGQMQQEIDLLGQFGIEADAARFALDLLQKSEDKGRSLSEAQRAEIDKKVQAYKQLASALATAKLQQDLASQASLAGLSARDQKIVGMQRQYGLPEDASSATGRMIGQSVDQQEIADATKSFLSTFSNGLINEGKSLGEAFGDAVKAAAANAMQKSLESLFGQIANGLASALTGGKSTTGGLAVLASAATSVGGTAISAGSTASLSTYAKAIQAIESGGNYGALGPITKNGDRAYGAYQVMGNNIGPWSQEALGKSMTASQFLADPSAQDAIFNNKFGSYANKYGASGAAQAWFGGPGSVGSGGGAKDILGTSGSAYVNKFNSQIAKMGETASSATSGLGQLSSGLSSVAGGLGGAAGGFNWSSLFSSSFTPTTTYGAFLGLANGGSVRGPGSATSDSIPTMLSNGEYVVNARQTKKHRRLIEAINNGTVGRMAEGGLVSPRTVSAPSAPRLSARGGRGNGDVSNPGVMMINISGASGDDHIRMLARQGTQEGIAAYNENQRRGGFGTLQTRYVAQKG